MSETTPFVFISYARKDGREYAEKLYKDLTARGYGAWWDERSLDYEQDFTADIEKALEKATHVAVCITPASKKSNHPNDGYVRRELLYALMLKKPIIPLRFAEIPPHIQIINLIWIDFWGREWENSFDALVSRLNVPLNEWKNRFGEAESFTDPFVEYLKSLYQSIVDYIGQTVFSEITLRSKATPDAVNAPAKAAPTIKTRVMGTAIPVNKTAPTPDPKPEQTEFENFAGAFEHYKGRVLLLGEPGAGKSTTLMAFARDRVSQRLSDSSAPLPVFGRIATWDAINTPGLADWLTEGEDEQTARRIKAEIEAGRALLLLDGLDELGAEEDDDIINDSAVFDPRKRFIRILSEGSSAVNKVVLTCRAKDYAEIGDKVDLNGSITLTPLSDSQIENYLAEFPILWQTISTDHTLKEITRTPLLLSIFTVAFKEMGEKTAELTNLAQSPGELRDAIFRMYVERRWEHEAARSPESLAYTTEDLYRELGHIAAGNVSTTSKDDRRAGTNPARENIIPARYFAPALLELATRLSITVIVDSSVRFIHLLLRDFFALNWAMTNWNHADAYKRRRALEARLKLRDFRQQETFFELLTDDDAKVRRRAAEALLMAKDKDAFTHAINSLLALFVDQDYPPRNDIVAVLKENLRERYEGVLLSVIENEPDIRVRHGALFVLGILEGYKFPYELLLELLNVDDIPLQLLVLRLYPSSWGWREIDPIIALLNADNDALKIAAVETLGEMQDERGVQPLIDALSSSRGDLQDHIVWALAKLGDKRAVQPVLRLLNPNSAVVNTVVINALGQFGALEATEPLLALLRERSTPYAVQLATVRALGTMNDNRVVAALAELLKTNVCTEFYPYTERPDIHDAHTLEDICSAAARSLKRIGTPEALAAVEEWRKRQG